MFDWMARAAWLYMNTAMSDQVAVLGHELAEARMRRKKPPVYRQLRAA